MGEGEDHKAPPLAQELLTDSRGRTSFLYKWTLVRLSMFQWIALHPCRSWQCQMAPVDERKKKKKKPWSWEEKVVGVTRKVEGKRVGVNLTQMLCTRYDETWWYRTKKWDRRAYGGGDDERAWYIWMKME